MRRYFDEILRAEMLLRVVVEETRRGTGGHNSLQAIEVGEIRDAA
jgi:hypothetical protein